MMQPISHLRFESVEPRPALPSLPPGAGEEASFENFLEQALKGVDIGQRPERWQPYAESRSQVLADAKPVQLLLQRYPDRRQDLLDRLSAKGLDPARALFLPIVARGDWVALLDEQGEIVAYAPFDGF